MHNYKSPPLLSTILLHDTMLAQYILLSCISLFVWHQGSGKCGGCFPLFNQLEGLGECCNS